MTDTTTEPCPTCHGERRIDHPNPSRYTPQTIPCPQCAYRPILSKDDVTEEVLQHVWSVVEGWYLDERFDWDDILSRAERTPLDDGLLPDFGGDTDTPALRKVKAAMHKWKREATA